MKIVADENLPLLEPLFSGLGSLHAMPGRSITPEHVADADLLLVRSVTAVNRELLEHSSVRFVGSATAGTDHVDRAWLESRGIRFAWAPGCNAQAVADYVISALMQVLDYQTDRLQGSSIGIIGCGNTGGAVRARCQALGLECRVCDPPLQATGETDYEFCDLAHALAADFISLHVPLEREGLHPTFHLLDLQRLTSLRDEAVLINASRGPVIDNAALKQVLQHRKDLQVVLDVWEHEPDFDPALMADTRIATPHIAGYSLDGKLGGSAMIYAAACRCFGLPKRQSLEQHLPAPPLSRLDFTAEADPGWALRVALNACYDLRRDDLAMRELCELDPDARRAGFDRMRREYPLRRDFNAVRIYSRGCDESLLRLLRGVGFDLR